MQLSPHFSDRELGVIGCEKRILDNATWLCQNVLEPIRQHYGRPVNVHDSYRDPQHNARVGGKPDSYHLYEGGEAAADIDVGGDQQPTYRALFDWLRLESKLPFDKVILEHNAAGQDRTVHIQVNRNATPRRQAFCGGTGDSHDYVLVETR